MNKKMASAIVALPLLVTDTSQSFANISNLDMLYANIPRTTAAQATVLASYLNRSQPLALLARGGKRPRCSRTGTGCR